MAECMDTYEIEQADREQYWAEVQRLKEELAEASQEQQKEDQE